MGNKTEHFETFKTQPIYFPFTEQDSLPYLVRTASSFLFFSSNTYTVSRPSLCKNTFHGICRDDYYDVYKPMTAGCLSNKEEVNCILTTHILRPQRQRVEKFEKVLKILASLRISYSTSSSFSRRNLCLSGDGSSVATAAVYRVRLRRRRVSWYCVAPDQPRALPAS